MRSSKALVSVWLVVHGSGGVAAITEPRDETREVFREAGGLVLVGFPVRCFERAVDDRFKGRFVIESLEDEDALGLVRLDAERFGRQNVGEQEPPTLFEDGYPH